MTQRPVFDKWLMRIKDILLIGASFSAAFLFLVKYYSLPGEVSAHASVLTEQERKIDVLQQAVVRIDGQFKTIDVKLDQTNKGVEEIKGWLKVRPSYQN